MTQIDSRESIFTAGRVAVISGGAKGLGLEAASACLERGMKVAILDNDEAAIRSAENKFDSNNLVALLTDVTENRALRSATNQIINQWGSVDLLVNNAAIMKKTGFDDPIDDWKLMFDINVWSLLQLTELLLPTMSSGAVVNLGSKEGITTPPGTPAYSASKAVVKVITEQLQHVLRTQQSDVTAHLLVPGFTHTPMNFPDGENTSARAQAAWPASRVIQKMIEGVDRNDFYIWCVDNETSLEEDHARLEWHYQDIIQNRPALSRWHPDYSDSFVEFTRSFKS